MLLKKEWKTGHYNFPMLTRILRKRLRSVKNLKGKEQNWKNSFTSFRKWKPLEHWQVELPTISIISSLQLWAIQIWPSKSFPKRVTSDLILSRSTMPHTGVKILYNRFLLLAGKLILQINQFS